MSGGGGGGSSGDDEWRRPKGSGGATGKCDISETTIMNSPVQSVISGLRVGDELEVILQTTPRKRLVAQDAQGAVAGSITSARLVDFIECIENGVGYVARVLSISGARVEVEISPK